MQKLYLAVLSSFIVTACGGGTTSLTSPADVVKESSASVKKLAAPLGYKPLLAIGQDLDSIAAYAAVEGSPAAVVGYIDMDLNGLLSTVNNGAGNNNISVLASRYPKSALVVAVNSVGKLGLINSGSYDANINRLIQTLSSYNRPVYLRFGYEFDGPWNQYDPTQYGAAFRRIHDMIQANNAQAKIAMVWQSSSYCQTGVPTTYNNNPIYAWWPGDGYVDFIAVSYFTPGAMRDLKGGTCNVANQAIDNVANFARYKNIPLMVAESTPQGFSNSNLTWHSINANDNSYSGPVTANAILTNWYYDFNYWITVNNVAIVTYINDNWQSQPMWASGNSGYWGDSRVQVNSTILNYWNYIKSSWLYQDASANPNLYKALGYN